METSFHGPCLWTGAKCRCWSGVRMTTPIWNCCDPWVTHTVEKEWQGRHEAHSHIWGDGIKALGDEKINKSRFESLLLQQLGIFPISAVSCVVSLDCLRIPIQDIHFINSKMKIRSSSSFHYPCGLPGRCLSPLGNEMYTTCLIINLECRVNGGN